MAYKDFNKDVEFLKKYVDVIILSSDDNFSQIAIVPQYQGRIMTSTTDGKDSFGWLNYEKIASKKIMKHINVYGGEERFWMGPEGGQFSIFFKEGDEFGPDDWQTPKVIDTESFEIASISKQHATFTKQTHLKNMSGFQFDIQIERTIKLLGKSQIQSSFKLLIPDDIQMVAFQSDNSLTNIGSSKWTKETGMLSIWLLNMLKPSSETTVVIPFKEGPESELGPRVNEYFGKVPAKKLVVKDHALFYSGDGQYRSKIGIGPKRAKPFLGSYDARGNVLTIVQYKFDPKASDYVNSLFEIQKYPFNGDVVNSYDDGPYGPGGNLLGPFYELETSSPAAALEPGKSIQHFQRTVHLKGTVYSLNVIAQKILGVTLKEITSAF